ncbi:MAG: RNA polymerase sigma factor [Bryobacterales bacterium]|nr:RNA polymerase sigma factor [Bryobacterales bacterium]
MTNQSIITEYASKLVSKSDGRDGAEQKTCEGGLCLARSAGTMEADPIGAPADPTTGERCLSEAEFAQAFQTHFRKTLRFLRSRGASEDLAEEVAQEAWARGWERLHQLRNPEVVDVWVNSIAKHLWRNRVVRDQRNRELSDNMAVDHSPDGGILWQQITQACGVEEQKLLNLHYVRGYTSNEIAERVGSTALAIRLRLMRTRRKLEQMFDRDLLFAGA